MEYYIYMSGNKVDTVTKIFERIPPQKTCKVSTEEGKILNMTQKALKLKEKKINEFH